MKDLAGIYTASRSHEQDVSNTEAPPLIITAHVEKPKNHRDTAFTMLELLVAMAVFSLLIVMLMGMVDSATKLWRVNENRVDAYREARAALGIMDRDLRCALAGGNTNYIAINAAAFVKLSEAEVQKNTNTAGAIFFLSAQPGTAQDLSGNKSDVCEVGYFVAYGNTSVAPMGAGSNRTMNLYRYFRSSDGTYSNLNGTGPGIFANVSITGAETDLLAKNVKSFRITPYQINSNGVCAAYAPVTNGALPDLLEMTITTLNQDTSRKMDSAADWTNASGPLTNAIKQVEQTFTTRVRMKDRQ